MSKRTVFSSRRLVSGSLPAMPAAKRRRGRRTSPLAARRRLWAESLESRQLLSASGWLHNAQHPADVNADSYVSPVDAILVINQLNRQQNGTAAAELSSAGPSYFLDVNNDQAVSPVDAVLVINQLGEQAEGQGEHEIRVRLELVHPNCSDFEPLFASEPAAFTIAIAELVHLRAYVEDLRGMPEGGVRSAYFDLSWDSNLLTPVGNVEFGPNFPNGQSAVVQGNAIDELGAADGAEPTGSGEVLLFTLPMRTNGVGTLTFSMDPAEDPGHEFSLYDVIGAVDPELVEFVGTSVEIINGLRPTAGPDSYVVTSFGGMSVPAEQGVLANDQDLDGQPLNTVLITGPSNGQLTLNSDGSFTYSPNMGFLGTDSFVYAAQDPDTLISCPVPVTLTVTAGNQPPVANDDSYTLDEDQVLTVPAAEGVLANDQDPEGATMTATLVSPPSQGELDLQADGSFTYTPPENFNGTVTFTYTTSDGLVDSEPATVQLQVASVNDPPQAQPDSYAVALDQVLTVPEANGVLINDQDADGDDLTVELVEGPANGTLELSANGSFSYTPNPGFSGTDTFVYVVSDGQAQSEPQTVVISVAESALVEFSFAITNLEGNPIDTTVVGGQFFVEVYVQDVSDPPRDGVFSAYLDVLFDADLLAVAGPLEFSSTYGNAQSGSVTQPGVLDEAGAVDGLQPLGGDPLLVFRVPMVANAPGLASITGEPADDLPLHEVVLINESEAVPPGRIQFGSAAINIIEGQRPTADPDTYETAEDTTLTVSAEQGVLANDEDPDQDPLTAVLIEGPEQGVLDLNADGSFVYTPPGNFAGTVTFQYVASDGTTQSDPATVTIEVTPVDDPPEAFDDQYSQPQINEPLVVGAAQGVLANDVEPDGMPLSAELVTEPENGMVELNADGSFTYTPNQDFLGVDTFTYVATSNGQSSEPATVTIEVGNLNAPSSISGWVFIDANGNGVREPEQLGVGGVEVHLVGTNVFGEQVDRMATTNRDGFYEFTDLRRGNYVLTATQPLHLLDGRDVVNEQESPIDDQFLVNLLPGVDLAEVNFGERGLHPRFVDNWFFFGSHNPNGILAAIGPDGAQDWYAFESGWTGFRSAEVSISDELTTVQLTLVRNDGEVFVANLPVRGNPQVRVIGDAETGYVVRINGGSSDFGLQTGGAGLGALAVDAAFAD